MKLSPHLRRALLTLGVAISVAGSGSALASPQSYAWSYGVDTGLEGDSGTELWTNFNTPFSVDTRRNPQAWSAWWGFTTSPVDNLELAFYAVLGTTALPSTVVDSAVGDYVRLGLIEAQARYHVIGPLMLLGKVDAFPGHGFGGGVLVVFEEHFGIGDFCLNVGPSVRPPPTGTSLQEFFALDATAGANLTLGPSFKLGVEAETHIGPTDYIHRSVLVGPTLTYGKGHFWAALNGSFGPDFTTKTVVASVASRLEMGASF